MSSTRLKNQKGEYRLQQHVNQDIYINRINDMKRVAKTNVFPQKGINVGFMPNQTLSYNPIDIENDLFGIRSTDLVNERQPNNPSLKSLPDGQFYTPLETYLPEPLVIEKNQRPIL